MTRTSDALLKAGRSTVASLTLLAGLFVLSSIYTASGGSSRELLIDEMLTNVMLVLGMQLFIGNTGVLSFGHMAFAEIAAYATAIVAIPLAAKSRALPDIPFGLEEIHFGAAGSLLFAVAVTVAIGSLVGVVVCRASGLAPTMITLAALFVVDQLVKNWDQLTRGAGGLSGIPQQSNSAWLWAGALGALL
ncbi:MAG TPA: hypothetical protein VE487_02805, partial [Ilumatobacter sp.]|nr:hypothetical protein [Ilumatobacter sp.]